MAKKKVREIPAKERIGWVIKDNPEYSQNRQLTLCGLGKSTFYYQPTPESDQNLLLMREIDEIYLKWPFFGVARMCAYLIVQGHVINEKRVRRLYRIMGICAIYQKPHLSARNKEHQVYPYLLRSIVINHSNQVWSTDITYIPMEHGFLYKVAFIDWNSRFILSYEISNTLDSTFVIAAFLSAVEAHGTPLIVNTDQGSQFTSNAFIDILKAHGVQVSMDGRGRALDNVRIERYWRSFKYECVYLNCITDGWHLQCLTDKYIAFYNNIRPHQHLDYKTPYYEYKNSFLSPLKTKI
jgi:putative transposase